MKDILLEVLPRLLGLEELTGDLVERMVLVPTLRKCFLATLCQSYTQELVGELVQLPEIRQGLLTALLETPDRDDVPLSDSEMFRFLRVHADAHLTRHQWRHRKDQLSIVHDNGWPRFETLEEYRRVFPPPIPGPKPKEEP